MVKHIVLFKFKQFENQSIKDTVINKIKEALLGLKDKIEVLQSIEVGINSNPEEEFDLVLITQFETMEDLHLYANHPAHLAVSKTYVAPVKIGRACVDSLF